MEMRQLWPQWELRGLKPDLVHGEGAAAEYLAGVAVAQDVLALVLIESHLPLV